jgi:divalent metal cation (Fe/Co/Zn/Cd) transporter
MAHIHRPLAVAVGLNTAVFAAEAAAGVRAQSLSLLLDAAHNFSDFDALVALAVGGWILVTTLLELRRSAGELLWPEQARCPHDDVVAAH